MDTIRLANGALLRYRSVPPYATAQAFQSLEDPLPPKKELESVAGHKEETLADEDSAEYQEWLDRSLRTKRLRAQRIQEMALDYGIVSWLLPPPSGFLGLIIKTARALGFARWRENPPKGWRMPETLSRYGVGEYINERLTYIYIELVTTRGDLERVSQAILEASGAGELRDEEVRAAEASFRENVGRGAAAGPAEPADYGDGTNARGDGRSEKVGA